MNSYKRFYDQLEQTSVSTKSIGLLLGTSVSATAYLWSLQGTMFEQYSAYGIPFILLAGIAFAVWCLGFVRGEFD